MKAVEFHGEVVDGIIRIPDEYRQNSEGRVKVIIMKEEAEKTSSLIEKLDSIKAKYKHVQPFKNIDPVNWQKAIRDEW